MLNAKETGGGCIAGMEGKSDFRDTRDISILFIHPLMQGTVIFNDLHSYIVI